jgi:hypothetical protein
MLRGVARVKTDISEELSASIIKVIRIGELGTLAITSNRGTLRRNTKYFLFYLLYVNEVHTLQETRIGFHDLRTALLFLCR